MIIASNCDLVDIVGVIVGYKIFWLRNIISKVPISSRTGVSENKVIIDHQRYLLEFFVRVIISFSILKILILT